MHLSSLIRLENRSIDPADRSIIYSIYYNFFGERRWGSDESRLQRYFDRVGAKALTVVAAADQCSGCTAVRCQPALVAGERVSSAGAGCP
jgi:hypothetical protein